MHTPEKSVTRRSLPWAAATLPLTLAASLSAQTAAEPASPAAGEQEVVVLSPFTVSDKQTQGYQATNSIGGTRSNTPIKDIPLNIQVFTKDLAQDIVATTQMDLERYNAAMVNGGADGKSTNTIQQPYNQFLFRGFVQNWGTRDGIRQYDPVDMQGISRVEVVKGPAAPLYGLSYAGGIMNSITKEVDFTGNATSIGGSVQSYGEWRATIDSNFVAQAGDAGKFGVRVNAARSNTADEREHSDGMVKYTQVNLAWQPRTGTEIRFLAEEGYREKPNGLGYFIKKKSDGTNVADDGVAGTERPIQVVYPNIPWDWNWADRYNMRTIDTTLYRGTIIHSITKDLSVTGYVQYGTRNNIDSQGWDAANNGGTSGTGGSAAGWDMGWAGNALGAVETGWLTITDANGRRDVIRKAYHYRDWSNSMHGYGATALYKLQTGDIRHVFTAGANAWAEKFHSVKGTTRSGSTQVVDFPISTSIDTSAVSWEPGTDYYIDVGATAAENNSNDYLFASWQGYAFKDRLKVNLAINRTNIKNVQHTNPTENITKLSKNSPMYGAMFDLTKEVSIFAVHSSSLFPTTDKDSYWNQMPPTVGKSNEIGLKTELFGGKVSGTLSYYRITQTGGAQQDPLKVQVNGTLGDLVPGGKQESKGFEADLVLQPLPEWQILFSYAHNDQKTKTATNRYLIGAPSANGHIDDQCSILTKYTFSHGPVSGLSLGLGFKYTGRALMSFNYDPSSSVYEQYNPSNIYLETFASYKFKAFGYAHRVQLNVKNLTKVPEYIGWYGEAGDTYATHRYEAPSKMTWTLGYALEF